MFLPLSDDDRKLYKLAFVTWTFLAINLAVFAVQIYNPHFTHAYSAVPAEIISGNDLVQPIRLDVTGSAEPLVIPHAPGPKPLRLTLLTSMFMHAGFMHIAGNMLFLWIFGDNVEHRFGARRFAAIYLLSGLAGALAQILLNPGSVIPMLGASGAIAGVLGAYLVLFPRNTVKTLVFYWIMSLPAFVVIGFWILSQFLGGFGSIVNGGAGGVAYAAHIGGLIAGLVLASGLRMFMRGTEPETPLAAQYRRDPNARRLW